MLAVGYMFLLIAVTAICSVECARLLPAAAQRLTNLHGSPQDVKLCTAFGFKSKSGLCIYDHLFKDGAIPKDVVIFKAETDSEVFKLHGAADVFVAHASLLENNSGAGLLLQSIGSYVRGLCKAGTAASTLVVLVEGKGNENILLENQILQIIEEAQSFKCNVQVILRA